MSRSFIWSNYVVEYVVEHYIGYNENVSIKLATKISHMCVIFYHVLPLYLAIILMTCWNNEEAPKGTKSLAYKMRMKKFLD